MAGVNKVILLGRLGSDPEVRNFGNGGKVVNLRLATSERYKDRDGNQQEKTEWHSVAIFNEKLGEVAEKYLRKGSEVYIEGQLATRKWQDQSGQDRYSTEIVLRQFRGEMALIGGRGNGGDAQPAEQPAPRGASAAESEARHIPGVKDARGGGARPGKAPGLDDDIPFSAETRA